MGPLLKPLGVCTILHGDIKKGFRGVPYNRVAIVPRGEGSVSARRKVLRVFGVEIPKRRGLHRERTNSSEN